MMDKTISIERLRPAILFDLLAAVIVYFLPALAHVTTIPFQLLEPFRLLVLFSLIVQNHKENACVLAITLPLFSFWVSGHPILMKVVLMSLEMLMNVLLYIFIGQWTKIPFWRILISIVLSKLFYYLIKFVFVAVGLLSMSLVSTSLIIQLVVALFISLVFSVLSNRKAILE